MHIVQLCGVHYLYPMNTGVQCGLYMHLCATLWCTLPLPYEYRSPVCTIVQLCGVHYLYPMNTGVPVWPMHLCATLLPLAYEYRSPVWPMQLCGVHYL